VRWPRRNPYVHRATYEGVLGTALQVTISARSEPEARAADMRLRDEISRLELIFSAYNQSSELRRWGRRETTVLSPEFIALLELAQDWQKRGLGTYNPAVSVLTALWKDAEQTNELPSEAIVAEASRAIQQPLFSVSHGHASLADDADTADGDALNFNAIAKGYIVDLASEKALYGAQPLPQPGAGPDNSPTALVDRVVVNIGGDLLHRGTGHLRVGIEDPRRPYDNVPPLATVSIANQGVATSGLARRGFTIGDRWFSHVLDPRNGQPVDHILSASVIAPNAVSADVIATVLSVLPAEHGRAFADGLDNVGCLIVQRTGPMLTNAFWDEHAASPN
jgi:FAD:protein FMN transferase